jgi:hypothetical protein
LICIRNPRSGPDGTVSEPRRARWWAEVKEAAMGHLTRQCSQCGTHDTKQSWASLDDATKDDVFDKTWTCPSCAWPEFELTEAEPEPAKA